MSLAWTITACTVYFTVVGWAIALYQNYYIKKLEEQNKRLRDALASQMVEGALAGIGSQLVDNLFDAFRSGSSDD